MQVVYMVVYFVQVIAKEVRTQSSLSSTAIVTIYLQDANDNVPEFNVGYYNIEDLSELTQPGERIAYLPQVSYNHIVTHTHEHAREHCCEYYSI